MLATACGSIKTHLKSFIKRMSPLQISPCQNFQNFTPMSFEGFGAAMRSVMSRPQWLSPTLILCKWPAWRHADQCLSLNGTIICSREKHKIFLFETHRPGYGKTSTMNLANEILGELCIHYQNCLFSASILVREQYPRIELSLTQISLRMFKNKVGAQTMQCFLQQRKHFFLQKSGVSITTLIPCN